MPANVVSLSIQTGSGGFTAARQIAEKLKFRYYDWEITSEAAARAGVSPTDVIAAERVPGFVERMMLRLGAVSAVGVGSTAVMGEPSPAVWTTAMASLTSDDYRQFIERIVIELAEQGDAVIVGHGAQYTLRDRPDVLRVLVHGSLNRRIERTAEEQSISMEEARTRVKQSDRDRAELLRRVYHFEWLDPSMYDLCINTDRLPEEYLAETIVAASQRLP